MNAGLMFLFFLVGGSLLAGVSLGVSACLWTLKRLGLADWGKD